MTLTTTNIPSVKDAVVEIDLQATPDYGTMTEIQAETISVNVSGGEVATRDLSPISGDVYSKSGKTASHDIQIQAIFTDGETSDLHPLLEAKKGLDVGLSYSPKGGAAGTRQFRTIGTLYRIDPPSLSGDGDVLYNYGIRGQLIGSDVSA